MKSVISSNISHIGYDQLAKIMTVRFKNGGEYAYHGIDDAMHTNLMKAPSIGSFLHTHIKHHASKVIKIK